MTLSPEIADRFSRLRMPDCAKTLGIEILSFDPAAREITITVEGRNEFRNPMSAIQGGFLCAMLDDAMAVAALFSPAASNQSCRRSG